MDIWNAVQNCNEERLQSALQNKDEYSVDGTCKSCEHYMCCLNRSLHLAITLGYLKGVELILDANCNVTYQNNEGNTALSLACYKYESYKMVEAILNKNAHINAVNNRGETPLMIASSYSEINVVKLLLEYGADINILDQNNKTALWHAKYSGRKDVENILVKAGANNDSALTTVLDAVCFDDVSSLKRAIASGWDVNEKDSYGDTALHYAIRERNVEIFEILLNAGCSVKYRTFDGATFLHSACFPGIPLEIITTLLEKDKDSVNICNNIGIYPIMEASYSCDIHVVTALINAGANLNVLCQNHSPLWDARMGNNLVIYQKLLEAGANPLLGDELQFAINFLFKLWGTNSSAVKNILEQNKHLKIHGFVDIELETDITIEYIKQFTQSLIDSEVLVYFVSSKNPAKKALNQSLLIFFSNTSNNLELWLASQSCAVKTNASSKKENFDLQCLCRKVLREELCKSVISNVQFISVLDQLNLPKNVISYIRYMN